MGQIMRYQASILALIIGAGLSSGALAQDYNNAGPVWNTPTNSADFTLVAVDATGAPVDRDQLNADGTFKNPGAAYCPCAIVDKSTLTATQQAAIDADPNAAQFDSKTSKIFWSKTDATTGDAHVVSRTVSGVKTGEAYGNAAGNGTAVTANGVGAVDASGNVSVFAANGVTVINTAGASTSVTAGGASFTDAGGNTTISGGNVTATGTISGGNVTATGTISGGNVLAGGRNVGQSLATHDQQISHVQNQADATDHRLNEFNGTGGTIENWASGVDNWRADTNAWRGGVDNTLAHYGSEISALQNWQGVATAQIANLQSRMGKVEGAAALAMTLQVPTLEAGKRFAFSGDFGGANSTGAFTVGTAFRLSDTWQFHAGGGAATNGQAWGGRVGFTGQW
jgi:hypothetical protein